MIIIGIDPSLSNTGWGIISIINNKLNFIASGTIITYNTLHIQFRLKAIHDQLLKIILQYQPEVGAMEESFVSTNALSSMKLAHVRGSIMLTMAMSCINISEYAPNFVKKAIVGAGRAQKSQLASMVKVLLPTSKIDSEHAADALAVAICHSRFIKA